MSMSDEERRMNEATLFKEDWQRCLDATLRWEDGWSSVVVGIPGKGHREFTGKGYFTRQECLDGG